jgi:ABC-type lipoprotein export system ATPase subunit
VAAIQAQGVTKTYDRVTKVLKGIDLAAQPGEIVVMIGRSGSGKTTLLNILAGLEKPSEGKVLVDGLDLSGLNEEARRELRLREVGIVFQRFHLMPELTVEENVALPMKLADRETPHERARELLGFFGLDHRVDAFPATLSGGETQRAAIARALGNEPEVILADEPTANLDEANARNALEALEQVAEELGTAVVVASHDPMCEQVADRLLKLKDGRFVGGDEEQTVAFDVQAGPR